MKSYSSALSSGDAEGAIRRGGRSRSGEREGKSKRLDSDVGLETVLEGVEVDLSPTDDVADWKERADCRGR